MRLWLAAPRRLAAAVARHRRTPGASEGVDAPTDLTVQEPRGLDAELEGYAWLPRMLARREPLWPVRQAATSSRVPSTTHAWHGAARRRPRARARSGGTPRRRSRRAGRVARTRDPAGRPGVVRRTGGRGRAAADGQLFARARPSRAPG